MTDFASTIRKLYELYELDVVFHVEHATGSGQRSVYLSHEQLIEYVKDPAAWLAGHYGVRRDDYLAWHESGYRVQCSAKTKAGKRCKHDVSTPSSRSEPGEWVRLQGEYCPVHGGEKRRGP